MTTGRLTTRATFPRHHDRPGLRRAPAPHPETSTPVTERFKDAVAAELVAAVREWTPPSGMPETTTAASVAHDLLRALPRADYYDELAGPFYDTEGMRTMLRVTRQALHKRVKTDTVIAIRSAEGDAFYPVWQFTDGHLDPELIAVWTRLRTTFTDLAAITWLRSPVRALDGMTPTQWLDSGRESEPVLRAADRAIRRWAA